MRSRHRIFNIGVVWGHTNAKECQKCSQMRLVVPKRQGNVDAISHTHPPVANLAKLLSTNPVDYNIRQTHLNREKQ
jgi:hypothetical protein